MLSKKKKRKQSFEVEIRNDKIEYPLTSIHDRRVNNSNQKKKNNKNQQHNDSLRTNEMNDDDFDLNLLN